MYIEYVILDGFKSYSTRTVIGPLDPHFNAVTGLNGSGKSNVLDSLCFVFGITDLSTVRANKLDELIYKQGQAGITKASVTIIINNKQPNSPLMHPYRAMKEINITRQISIGGKNRYFINNHPATPKNIFDFYNTARMNVNNARFLIMQGRVTKVVNMKPKELLELIEEATGTRIYENKKNVALRLIKRKEEKMQEIEKIIKDDITPTMQKLKSDKDDFLKYSSVKEEYDRLKKVQTHLQYKYYLDILREHEETYKNKKEEMESNQRSGEEMEELIKNLEKKLKEEQKTLQKIQKQMEGYTAKVDGLNKEISKLKSNKKISEKDYKELLESMEQTRKEIETHTKSLGDFGSVDSFQEFAKKVELDKKKLKELQELANTGGKVGQMSQLKSKMSQCTSELENTERIVEHLEEEVKKNEEKLKEYNETKSIYDSQVEELKRRKEDISRQISEINRKMKEHGEGDIVGNLQGRLRQMREKREQLSQELCMNEQEIRKYKISVNVPQNKEDYLGQIFDILTLNEAGLEYSVPIHVLVGYKFLYLVTTTSQYARAMFKVNNFATSNRKVTIVPMNDLKVNYLLTEEDLRQIKSTLEREGGGNRGRNEGEEEPKNQVLGYWQVFKYERNLTKLVQYISGNCVFCRSDQDARKIAYSKELKKRFATATLQGDKYDTTGTMSGGGNKYLNQILKTVSMVKKTKEEIGQIEKDVEALTEEMVECKKIADELHELKSKQELCTSDLLGLEMRQKGGEYYTIKEKIKNQKQQLEVKRERIKELKQNKTEYEKQLENLSKSKEGDLEEKIKILKESMKKTTHQLELLREQNADQQLKKSTLEHQINSNKKELENKEEIKKTLEETIEKQNSEIKNKEEELKLIKKEAETENSEINKVQQVITETEKEKEKLSGSIDESNLQIKQLEYDLETCEKDINEYQVKVSKMEKEYPYVKTEENFLLEAQYLSSRTARSSIADSLRESRRDSLREERETSRTENSVFRKDSVRSVREKTSTKNELAYVNSKLERLQKLKEKLSRRINQKAQQMYENILYEYNDLINKLSKVQNDRNKIEKTISDLDRKKKESLEEVFIKVNNHFAEIFSLLLNNATCKLVPSDNKDINSGINMKICFNNVWKNSLSELSGGQRSLLALSLILAMLKVKPAPIYILDEIDAALDLSHTQNIGKMVKQQFKYSQFIIISLKEGMFTNANILFKVKFLNGRSTITRHPNTNLGQSGSNKGEGDTNEPTANQRALESPTNGVENNEENGSGDHDKPESDNFDNQEEAGSKSKENKKNKRKKT